MNSLSQPSRNPQRHRDQALGDTFEVNNRSENNLISTNSVDLPSGTLNPSVNLHDTSLDEDLEEGNNYGQSQQPPSLPQLELPDIFEPRDVALIMSNTNNENSRENRDVAQTIERLVKGKMENIVWFVFINYVGFILGTLYECNILQANAVFFIISSLCIMNIFTILIIKGKMDWVTNEGKSQVFRVIHWLCFASYVFSLGMLNSGYNVSLYPITIIGWIFVVMESLIGPESPTFGEKMFETLFKYTLWTQLFFIALKIDGSTLIPWGFALFVIISIAFISLMFLVVLVIIFVSTFLGNSCYESNGVPAIVGTGLYLLMSFANVLWGAVTICLEHKLTTGVDLAFLVNLFYFGTFTSIFLLVFTVVFRRRLMIFLKHETLSILDEMGEIVTTNQGQEVQINASYVPVTRHQYLAKVTSTYFSTLQKSMSISEKATIEKWNKEISRAKLSKYSQVKKQVPPLPYANSAELPNNMAAKRSISLGFEKHLPKAFSAFNNKKQPAEKKEESTSPTLSDRDDLNYSFDDRDIIEEVRKSMGSLDNLDNNEEKDSCFVCESNEADAVVMECGHGGMCYECAMLGWQTSNKCHICRREIKSVLRVRNLPRLDMVKVVDTAERIYGRQDEISFE